MYKVGTLLVFIHYNALICNINAYSYNVTDVPTNNRFFRNIITLRCKRYLYEMSQESQMY